MIEQYKKRIKNLISQIIQICEQWIIVGNDGKYRFVDPNDKIEISAHYGATHAASAFILWGKIEDNPFVFDKGLSLMRSIIDRWDISKKLDGYHYDFNNFALTLVPSIVDKELASEINLKILSTKDSNHYTINWLPMRIVVNMKRKELTNDYKYNKIIDNCKNRITKATNSDGGIEDRMPYGKSYNLQYNVATVAALQYLRVIGEDFNLDKELGFLLNAVIPDGDINYLGRGTNQIFAWGMWIYLLSSSSHFNALELALSFVERYLSITLQQNNIMFNKWSGEEKYLWWDYHYASVYIAHCLLWLVLAYRDIAKAEIHPLMPSSTETGLHVCRFDKAHVVWFNGRREYLAERGPCIASIWTNSLGSVYKGSFGPWQGAFGNKYMYEDIVIKNYCGLIEVKKNKDWSKNRFIHKLLPELTSKESLCIQPIFCPVTVAQDQNVILFRWFYNGESAVFFNMPTTKNPSIELYVDGNKVQVNCVEAIRSQYQWMYLQQSQTIKGKEFLLKMIID